MCICCVRDVLQCIAIVKVIVRACARACACACVRVRVRVRVRVPLHVRVVIAEIKKRKERLWVSQNPQKNINK